MVRTFLACLKGLCSFSSKRGPLVGRCEVEPSYCKLFQFASDRAIHGTASSISSRLWNSAAHIMPGPTRLRPTGSVTRFSKKGSTLQLAALLPSHTPGNKGGPNRCPYWCSVCAQSIWQMFMPIFIRFCHLPQNLLHILVGGLHGVITPFLPPGFSRVSARKTGQPGPGWTELKGTCRHRRKNHLLLI